jgi:hypothetical protein
MNIFNIRKTFEMKKERGWPEVYFCIDLHGTIIPSGKTSKDKTEKLVFYPYAKEVLQWMSRRKDIIMILWTSTPIKRIINVFFWLDDNGIYFDYLNSNSHAQDTERSDFSKKFYFNVLIDDRAGFEPKTDWKLIKNELISIGEWNVNTPLLRKH